MTEKLGARIAYLRATLGWTQQELADRLAISRTAVSHFEMDLATPSERTIVLMAGLFRREPPALVAGTYYPAPKADRLPPIAARYTEVEKDLLLFENDLRWLTDPHLASNVTLRHDTLQRWIDRLLQHYERASVGREQQMLSAALHKARTCLTVR